MAEGSIERQQLNTPIGKMTIEASQAGIRKIYFGPRAQIQSDSPKAKKHLKQAKQEIEEYFSGLRKDFRFEVELEGSAFQRKVWEIARKIPFGKTVSYQAIAIKMGSKKSARAVGTALKNNPVPLVVPCHRVIASSGRLSGFLGGTDKKEWLIEHEL
jgi:methylated-DNA-[protein]-cysteine S-methyltransferase